jgi:DNA-binding response OmpR family regulator
VQERETFDLIVLDVMLPSRSGFDVAKGIAA